MVFNAYGGIDIHIQDCYFLKLEKQCYILYILDYSKYLKTILQFLNFKTMEKSAIKEHNKFVPFFSYQIQQQN